MEKDSSLMGTLAATVILFALGLFGPSMTLVPHFGELTGAVKLLKPSFDSPQTVSIATGIVTLFQQGEYVIGGIIFLFSVLFPIWKFGVLWSGIAGLKSGADPTRELVFIEKLGKFSMLDVYVMAVLVIAIKGLPGGTEVRLNWALLAFAASILLSMKITSRIEAASKLLKRE